eukprot:TRINITY_DN28018_c0_g1_i1.p1 TRINITY_DN28018_c0_g1~~TRINITY_DN28018_c0_g1_i1.p1  ORF type:complete len:445 (+),score=116.07 TRINITY_DN28018_c0_g1_i1:63-1397(+)
MRMAGGRCVSVVALAACAALGAASGDAGEYHLACFDGATGAGVCDRGVLRFDEGVLRDELARRVAALGELKVAIIGSEKEAVAQLLQASLTGVLPDGTVPEVVDGGETCATVTDPAVRRLLDGGAGKAGGTPVLSRKLRADTITFCFRTHILVDPAAAAANVTAWGVDAALLVRPAGRYLVRERDAAGAAQPAPLPRTGWYSWLSTWVSGSPAVGNLRVSPEAVAATVGFLGRLGGAVHPVLVITDLDGVQRKVLGRLHGVLRRALPEVLFASLGGRGGDVLGVLNAHPQVYRDAGDVDGATAPAELLRRSYHALYARKVYQHRDAAQDVLLHLHAFRAAHDALDRRQPLPSTPYYAWALRGLLADRRADLAVIDNASTWRDAAVALYALLAAAAAAALFRTAYSIAAPLLASRAAAPAAPPPPAAAPEVNCTAAPESAPAGEK